MSLFENDEYQWRETFFIFFQDGVSLDATTIRDHLSNLDPRYQVTNVRANDQGEIESITLFAPDDYAAMDISVVSGEDIQEQKLDLIKELQETAEADELSDIQRIERCDRRFEVYHFEQLVFVGRSPDDEDDDFMDPGAVLIVLQNLASLCNGIVVDPQSNTLL